MRIYKILSPLLLSSLFSIPSLLLAATPEDIHDLPDRDLRVPAYTYYHPSWAIELNTSFNALGGSELVAAQQSKSFLGISMQVEYLFPYFQEYGVFGLGPSFTLYPFLALDNVTPSAFSVLSYGGQIRYQARFWREQPLVPVLGYRVDNFAYQFVGGPSGTLVAKGPIFGLWILLNILEPSAASSFYTDAGVLRSYLIFEAQNLSGKNADIEFFGTSYYFGLRFEF